MGEFRLKEAATLIRLTFGRLFVGAVKLQIPYWTERGEVIFTHMAKISGPMANIYRRLSGAGTVTVIIHARARLRQQTHKARGRLRALEKRTPPEGGALLA